jgi:hypothetical protein
MILRRRYEDRKRVERERERERESKYTEGKEE